MSFVQFLSEVEYAHGGDEVGEERSVVAVVTGLEDDDALHARMTVTSIHKQYARGTW